jgi:hypothetical protein
MKGMSREIVDAILQWAKKPATKRTTIVLWCIFVIGVAAELILIPKG